MKRCYRFHPGEYAIGENEQFYGRMAQRGWLLDKRGAYLSRFRKGEPQQRKYRIELSSPHFLDDDQSLPEEQIQLYEECGWKLTAENGLVQVFFPHRKAAMRRNFIPTRGSRRQPSER